MKEQTTTEMAAKKRCSVVPFDRISELPDTIAQSILMLLPLRDMARTSVLSKHWRYQWISVPQLVFEDDPNYHVSKEEKYRYNGKRVFEILSKHQGPILSFTLNMRAWPSCTEVDSIIPFLSRKGIQELTLLMPNKRAKYKLSSSLLSSLNLRDLALSACVLHLRPFLAFNNLVNLTLVKVRLEPSISISSCPVLKTLILYETLTVLDLLNIDAPNLKCLYLKGKLTRIGTLSTPVLKVLRLYEQPESYTGNRSADLMNLLLSLPLLKELSLNNSFLKVLGSDELPNWLNNLGLLEFYDVDLCHMEQLPFALWFIRSSPNIRKLNFYLPRPLGSLAEAELYLKMQDRSKYSLLKLQRVQMILSDTKIKMGIVVEFSKFLLDMSPALEILSIGPHLKHIGGDEYKKLFEMACAPRASKVRIVCGDLESVKVTLKK